MDAQAPYRSPCEYPREYPCLSNLARGGLACHAPARSSTARTVQRCRAPREMMRVYIYRAIIYSGHSYVDHMHPLVHARRGTRARRGALIRARASAGGTGRRTGGGGGGAQQLRVGVAGADRVGVEVRSVGDNGVVTAPRGDRRGHPKRRPRCLAHDGHRGAARRLGLDPRGARRAHVAAGGTGHVRACAQQHHTRGPSAVPQQPRIPVPEEYRRVPTQYSATAYRPPAPWSAPVESPRVHQFQHGPKPPACSAQTQPTPQPGAVPCRMRRSLSTHRAGSAAQGCTRYRRGTRQYGH
jgi:hypothetical protein